MSHASHAHAAPVADECRPAYRPDVDGLRAVAILAVVAYHAFPTVLTGGFVGVDIFFVISGFLISSIVFGGLRRGEFSFFSFYVHRVRRIFPALILVLASAYLIGWFSMLPEEFKLLGKHMAAGASFVQNVVLWKEAGYFDTASELKPLLHLWSLAVEEQFYLVYPFLIWMAWRLRIGVFPLLVGVALLSFGLNVYGVRGDAAGTFFLAQTRLWELLAGAALAHLRLFRQAWLTQRLDAVPSLRDGLSVLGLLLLMASALGLSKELAFPGWWGLGPVVGACLLILAGPTGWANRRVLAHAAMVFVGLISYPLYLWHWPLLSFLQVMSDEMPAAELRAAAVAASFLLAWLTYRLWERPLRFGGAARLKTAALCAAMALVGLIGYNAFDREGLVFRHRLVGGNPADFALQTKSNDECRRVYPEPAPAFCMLAKPEKPTVAVVGDSHGNHLYAGLTEAAQNSRANVMSIGEGACLPFFDMASFEVGQDDKCMASMNRVLQFSLDTASIKTIVVAARGPLYLHGVGYQAVPDERGHRRRIVYTARPELTDARQAYEAALRETLRRLVASGKRIVFVVDIAELDFEPKWCGGAMPLSLGRGARKACGVARDEHDRRSRDYREIVFRVLAEFPSVKTFDAAAEFCDAAYCWAKQDGKMLYRDANHLSAEGARRVAPGLMRLIE